MGLPLEVEVEIRDVTAGYIMRQVEWLGIMRAGKWYIAWRILFTLLVGFFGISILLAKDDCIGTEAGLLLLLLAALPSLVLLGLALKNRMAAYRVSFIYGVLVAVATVAIALTAYGGMWLIIWFPMFGFVIEGVLLYISEPLFGGVR